MYYRILISPVADLPVLHKPALNIAADRCIDQVSFPALMDEGEKYLSEKFRILIVPSLTTHKHVWESPAEYHSESGPLIVGDPDVSASLPPQHCTNVNRI